MSDPSDTVALMRSPQKRQRKRERRRLEREEKRRCAEASAGTGIAFAGDISRTLFEYARPLVETHLARFDLEEVRARLLFAAVVWNAVIEADGNAVETFTDLVADMGAKVQDVPPAAAILVLAKRKTDEFGDDLRLVSSVDVQPHQGRLRVAASSRSEVPPPASSGWKLNPASAR